MVDIASIGNVGCKCQVLDHSVERHGRQLVLEHTTYTCGAVKKEVFTSNVNIGRIEFSGCGCR